MSSMSRLLGYRPSLLGVIASALLALAAAALLSFSPAAIFLAALAFIAVSLVWLYLCARSRGYANHRVQRFPDPSSGDLDALLSRCAPGFASEARASADLVSLILGDFPGLGYEEELGLFLSNLRELARSQTTLLAAGRASAAKERRVAFNAILARQEATLRERHALLSDFAKRLSLDSGHRGRAPGVDALAGLNRDLAALALEAEASLKVSAE
jgi:hypothetical protein